jgi:hypothetical protein
MLMTENANEMMTDSKVSQFRVKARRKELIEVKENKIKRRFNNLELSSFFYLLESTETGVFNMLISTGR